MISWTYLTTADPLDYSITEAISRSTINSFSNTFAGQTVMGATASLGTSQATITQNISTFSQQISSTFASSPSQLESTVGAGGVTQIFGGSVSSFSNTSSQSMITIGSSGSTTSSQTFTFSTTGALSTTHNQTSTTTANTTFYFTSTTSTFSYSYYASFTDTFTGGTFSYIDTTSSSYVDITRTDATSSTSTITLTNGSSFQSSYNLVQAIACLPQPGEIAWLASASFSPCPVSLLSSETGTFSFLVSQSALYISIAPSRTTLNSALGFTTFTFVVGTTDDVTGSQSVSGSDFANGGFTTSLSTSFEKITVTTTQAIFLETIVPTTAGNIYATQMILASSIANTTTAGTIFLGQSRGQKTASYTSQTIAITTTASASVSQTLLLTNITGAYTSSISTSAGGTSGYTSTSYGVTTMVSYQQRGGISLLNAAATALTISPNAGFRITPTDNLATQIGLQNTSLSLASSDASNIFSLCQTVPIQWPFLQSWTDTNSVSYSAVFRSDSLTVTEMSSSSYLSGTSTLTSFATSLSSLNWTSAGPITQTLFDALAGSLLVIGSGTYYTDLTGRATIILPIGYYGSSTGSTAITQSTSFTQSTADAIRDLTLASFDYRLTNPFVVETVSSYNQ